MPTCWVAADRSSSTSGWLRGSSAGRPRSSPRWCWPWRTSWSCRCNSAAGPPRSLRSPARPAPGRRRSVASQWTRSVYYAMWTHAGCTQNSTRTLTRCRKTPACPGCAESVDLPAPSTRRGSGVPSRHRAKDPAAQCAAREFGRQCRRCVDRQEPADLGGCSPPSPPAEPDPPRQVLEFG